MTAVRKGIDNIPGAGEIKSLGDLCYECLEPLRAHFDKSVTITSGYRSEAAVVELAPLVIPVKVVEDPIPVYVICSVPNIKVPEVANNVDFDQLILEYYDKNDPAGGWVHISYNEKGNNRKQVLTFDGDKYENGLPDMEWKDGKVVGS